MHPIDYFKLQSKNLLKDFKTLKTDSDSDYYESDPSYFDVVGIFLHFDPDEDNFSLMNAQHIIAQLAGFYKWTDMLKASENLLKLGKLLFDNQHKISYEDWEYYIKGVESDNKTTFDDEFRLQIFTEVFADVDGHESLFGDFQLHPKH
jgi:hypothetical protein